MSGDKNQSTIMFSYIIKVIFISFPMYKTRTFNDFVSYPGYSVADRAAFIFCGGIALSRNNASLLF